MVESLDLSIRVFVSNIDIFESVVKSITLRMNLHMSVNHVEERAF